MFCVVLLAMEYCRSLVADSQMWSEVNLHAVGVKFMATGQTHDFTDAVDIFLQAYDALALSAFVLALPLCESGINFLGFVDL